MVSQTSVPHAKASAVCRVEVDLSAIGSSDGYVSMIQAVEMPMHDPAFLDVVRALQFCPENVLTSSPAGGFPPLLGTFGPAVSSEPRLASVCAFIPGPCKVQVAHARIPARSHARFQSAHARFHARFQSAHARFHARSQSAHARFHARSQSAHARFPARSQSAHARFHARSQSAHARFPARSQSAHARFPARSQVAHARFPARFQSAHARSLTTCQVLRRARSLFGRCKQRHPAHCAISGCPVFPRRSGPLYMSV